MPLRQNIGKGLDMLSMRVVDIWVISVGLVIMVIIFAFRYIGERSDEG